MTKEKMDEMYEKIKKLTPQHRLEIAKLEYLENVNDIELKGALERMMELGFNLAQPDGWRHIAPAWCDEDSYETKEN